MTPGRIVFGNVRVCRDCLGHAGFGGFDKNERARELRAAKRHKEPPPPLERMTCSTCKGSGVVPA